MDGERLWVAGGTGPGEEEILLDVYRNLMQQDEFDNLHLVIVPRKPERFDEVAELIKQSGFKLVRYSRIKNQAAGNVSIENQASGIEPVILGDTMGDLRKFYSLASVIFVGRSLVPMGGSDMMEAAALGKCTIFGPYTFNFRQTVEALLAGHGAIEVKDGAELLITIKKCLSEPEYARTIGQAGQAVIRQNQGATARTIEALSRMLSSTVGRNV
jgi:3-deoxy-D-manno-octulosonic-acid transferase